MISYRNNALWVWEDKLSILDEIVGPGQCLISDSTISTDYCGHFFVFRIQNITMQFEKFSQEDERISEVETRLLNIEEKLDNVIEMLNHQGT